MIVRLLRPFSCRLCQRNFIFFDKLQVHKYRHRAIKFGQCQNKFIPTQGLSGNLPQNSISSSTPSVHIKSDTNKLHQCTYCHKRFARDYMKRHIRTHTKEKPYQCTYCQKTFSQSGDLKRHILTHTKEKPYQCEYCQKRFSSNGYLKRHIRTHTGEKQYVCVNIVRKGFTKVTV